MRFPLDSQRLNLPHLPWYVGSWIRNPLLAKKVVAKPRQLTLRPFVKRGAEINVYGVLETAETPLPVFALMQSGATIGCYMVYELLVDPTRLRAAVDYYLPLFNSGQIAPVADDQLFTFDQSVEAFQHMESNTQLGKVIVSF